MVSISKTVGRRVKLNEIWNSGIVVIHIYGILTLQCSRSLSGSFGAFVSNGLYLKYGWS